MCMDSVGQTSMDIVTAQPPRCENELDWGDFEDGCVYDYEIKPSQNEQYSYDDVRVFPDKHTESQDLEYSELSTSAFQSENTEFAFYSLETPDLNLEPRENYAIQSNTHKSNDIYSNNTELGTLKIPHLNISDNKLYDFETSSSSLYNSVIPSSSKDESISRCQSQQPTFASNEDFLNMSGIINPFENNKAYEFIIYK